MRAIEQCDPVEKGHLTQFLDFLANFNLHLYLYLGRLTVRATCLLVLPVATYGTGSPLPSWAFLCLMTPLPATEALDLTWVAVHENRHFHWSVGMGDEW